MIGPSEVANEDLNPKKKAKTAKAIPKAKVPKAAPIVPQQVGASLSATVVPVVKPANTRGMNAQLALNSCRYHVKKVFLGKSDCAVVNCTRYHHKSTQDFTKSEMLKWLREKIPGDSDYAALEVAIKRDAR